MLPVLSGTKKVKKQYNRLEILTRVNRDKLSPLLHNNETVEQLILRITEADPSNMIVNDKPVYKMTYTQWLIDQYINKQFKLEDVHRVREDIELFVKIKHNLPVQERDIYTHDYRHLKELLQRVSGARVNFEEPISHDGVEVLYEGELGSLYVPLTVESSCRLGKGTKWCTSAEQYNRFEYYNALGRLYVWIDKLRSSNKYQFHFPTAQFMDALDNPIDDQLLQHYHNVHPILRQLFAQGDIEMLSYLMEKEEDELFYIWDNIIKYINITDSQTTFQPLLDKWKDSTLL